MAVDVDVVSSSEGGGGGERSLGGGWWRDDEEDNDEVDEGRLGGRVEMSNIFSNNASTPFTATITYSDTFRC